LESWDFIIIGAGAAGLTAGLYGARSGLKTLILEEKLAGGTTAEAPLVENYLGFESISGMDLSQKMVEHAKNAGVRINEFEEATGMELRGENKIVKTHKAIYEAKAVLIASGSYYRELNVPGEKEFRGRGVSYCGICDGPLFKGKRVFVVGGGNSALITALYLAGLASEVKVVHRRDAFRAEEALVKDWKGRQNGETLWNSEVKEIRGDKVVRNVVLLNSGTGEKKEIAVDGVFIQVGESPNSQAAKEAGVAVDEYGNIVVNALQHTNIEGVYAAGDVSTHPVKQIGTAVGMGITAALEAYAFIKRPYYKQ
jgi:thioredoxin reductase (NADPH)